MNEAGREDAAAADPPSDGASGAAPGGPSRRRKLDRAERRVQLIEATIEVIARLGFARTTLTEVARQADLSHGLVNFHFASKEGLLNETLGHLAEEYHANWTRALAEASADPAARLDALLAADFDSAICTPTRLSAWCAFWGEAQSRPLYQARCGANDRAYKAALERVCRDLASAGGYAGDPARTARALRVMLEGIWLDLVTMTGPQDRADALRTVRAAAAAFFPRHMGEEGPIAPAGPTRP